MPLTFQSIANSINTVEVDPVDWSVQEDTNNIPNTVTKKILKDQMSLCRQVKHLIVDRWYSTDLWQIYPIE